MLCRILQDEYIIFNRKKYNIDKEGLKKLTYELKKIEDMEGSPEVVPMGYYFFEIRFNKLKVQISLPNRVASVQLDNLEIEEIIHELKLTKHDFTIVGNVLIIRIVGALEMVSVTTRERYKVYCAKSLW